MSYLGDRLHPWLRSLLPSTPQKRQGGNLLTAAGTPTIVLREFRMNRSSPFAGGGVALRRHRLVCLVLAALLLYNPFFAAPRSGRSLEVCHPASHRATVGASELEHFSPAGGWGSLAAFDTWQAEFALPDPDISVPRFLVSASSTPFPRPFFPPGLWFRPPPVR